MQLSCRTGAAHCPGPPFTFDPNPPAACGSSGLAAGAGVVGLDNPHFCCYQSAVVQCIVASPAVVAALAAGHIDTAMSSAEIFGDDPDAVTAVMAEMLDQVMRRRAGDGLGPVSLEPLRAAVRFCHYMHITKSL